MQYFHHFLHVQLSVAKLAGFTWLILRSGCAIMLLKGDSNMTLGEKITLLRGQNKMSQGDLAEKLEVSRQSVSKWETGASVPELDKLIMMSKLFNITLDELVGSDSIPENTMKNTEPQTNYIIREKQRNSKQTVGFILFGAGLFAFVLGLILSPILLAIGVCLIIYGIVFIAVKKNFGIVCAWVSASVLLASAFLFSVLS